MRQLLGLRDFELLSQPMGTAKILRRQYTWSDYRSWDDGERWEIICGEAFCMSPAPATRHQVIVSDLFGVLYQHFQGRSCRPLVAPTEVKLSASDMVQPDILVICEPAQMRSTHIEGPPALVVEVLSPSTDRHDRVRKLRLYARHGVGEYWLVQPNPAVVEVLQLSGNAYQVAGVYTETEILRSPSFPDLAIELSRVFTLPVPASEQVDEVREASPPYVHGGPGV